MRVITGEAKGRRLKGPPGPKTRPMADKIKEAVFSALEALGVDAGRVLDLYAGTGAVGIEALSRGADRCDFVDNQAAACAVVRDNLAHTKLASKAEVHQLPVTVFLSRRAQPYDLIFVDPPYADPDIFPTLERLSTSSFVLPGTVVVLGHAPTVDVPERVGALTLLKERCHGGSCFAIFEVAEADASAGGAEKDDSSTVGAGRDDGAPDVPSGEAGA